MPWGRAARAEGPFSQAGVREPSRRCPGGSAARPPSGGCSPLHHGLGVVTFEQERNERRSESFADVCNNVPEARRLTRPEIRRFPHAHHDDGHSVPERRARHSENVVPNTRDGLSAQTSMHDVIAVESGNYFVPIFNPGRNRAQVSSLRLINNETRRAEVRIRAVDDRGRTPGEEVLLYVGRQSARTIPSRVLEEGRWGLVGGIGTGYGTWRLTVSADVPIEVLSLMESPTGHLVNHSP